MNKLSLEEIKNILQNNDLLIDYKINQKNIIESISYDSRKVGKKSLFFCKGENYKEEYLGQSIENGAIAYVSEIKYENYDTSYFIVKNILKAMAIISINFYNYPNKALKLIGITGTKGKTTTVYFLKNIIETYLDEKIGVISTIDICAGKRSEESSLTTPESIEVQKILDEMRKCNLKYSVMEVSSQAYKRDRLYGLEFEYGIFTNISEDHISKVEHPTFEDYLNCKIEFLKHCKNIIINKQTNNLNTIVSKLENKNIIYYGMDSLADYYASEIIKEKNGFTFKVINEKQKYKKKFRIKILGRFNIENALSAIVIAKLLGIDDNSIRKGLLKTKVNGRMNVYERKGITIVVDYAHNGLSFSKLYETIKSDYPNRKIISVGGGVGGKAYKRREDFGKIVGENSNYIYLTADDPQFEDVKDICNEIAQYIQDKDKYEIIEDRKKAIQKAIKNAKVGDVVVLLAKGEDKYQRIKNEYIAYEGDLTIAKKCLRAKESDK